MFVSGVCKRGFSHALSRERKAKALHAHNHPVFWVIFSRVYVHSVNRDSQPVKLCAQGRANHVTSKATLSPRCPCKMEVVSFTLMIDDIVFPDGATCMGCAGGGGEAAELSATSR